MRALEAGSASPVDMSTGRGANNVVIVRVLVLAIVLVFATALCHNKDREDPGVGGLLLAPLTRTIYVDSLLCAGMTNRMNSLSIIVTPSGALPTSTLLTSYVLQCYSQGQCKDRASLCLRWLLSPLYCHPSYCCYPCLTTL